MEIIILTSGIISFVLLLFTLHGLNQIKKGGTKLYNASKELENKKLGNAGYFIYNGAKTILIVMFISLVIIIFTFFVSTSSF